MADVRHIHLSIITPDGVKLQEDVRDLTAPSVEGEFGVLPGHRPLLAALRTGIVSYHTDEAEHWVAVGPGFVEVYDDRAMLLTERFIEKADVDPVQARLDLKEADAALDAFTGEPGSAEHGQIIMREAWAAARLELYGDPPPPTLRTFDEFQLLPHESYTAMEEAPPLSESYLEQVDERDRARQRGE